MPLDLWCMNLQKEQEKCCLKPQSCDFSFDERLCLSFLEALLTVVCEQLGAFQC